jgi:hypothetical protein
MHTYLAAGGGMSSQIHLLMADVSRHLGLALIAVVVLIFLVARRGR